ncbi:MAG TPA: ATP-binding protein, partial [Myxococcaceae bacterium]|nr:ATP-binding protein [Myxococcaceae bacterium]
DQLGALTVISLFCWTVAARREQLLNSVSTERDRQNAELARAHDELRAWQRNAITQEKLVSLGMLASGVAQEINNPMSYVTANVLELTDYLSQEKSLSPSLTEYRDQVLPATLDGIGRVNSIVADLRRFARGEPEQPTDCDIADEADSAVRIASTHLKEGQAIITQIQPVPLIAGVRPQVGQVMLNLIVNGIQALPEEGAVTVETCAVGEEVRLIVRDNGSGMSPEIMAKLFQPFFTTKEPGRGTGLGLAVAHGIVAYHGGKIEVESSPGVGSAFTVRLPAKGAKPLIASASEPSIAQLMPPPMAARFEERRAVS